MRRSDKSAPPDAAVDLLRRAPFLHLAGSLPDGLPVLRAVHPVWVDDRVCFHGAVLGEKLGLVGRPVAATWEEVVAEVPSHWMDPQRACPATTFFRSVMVHGTLIAVEDAEQKARVLQALMERYQPEGGYRPITAADPLYAASIRGTAVLAIDATEVVAKVSLGQGKPEAVRRRVVEAAWRRGGPTDAAAVEAMLEAAPLDPPPPFLAAPPGVRLRCAPTEADLPAALALLGDTYWNQQHPPARVAAAHRNTPAWVCAYAGSLLVGTARAITDGAKLAYVMDVAVHPDHRRRGIATALLRLLLDHPAVRGAHRVELHTRDAGPVYAGLGFTPAVDPPWRECWRLVRAEASG